jgi:hypothetical protein
MNGRGSFLQNSRASDKSSTRRHPRSRLGSAKAFTAATSYRRREPTATVLYTIVQHYLESYLARGSSADPFAAAVPGWVEDALPRPGRRDPVTRLNPSLIPAHPPILSTTSPPSRTLSQGPNLNLKNVWISCPNDVDASPTDNACGPGQ